MERSAGFPWNTSTGRTATCCGRIPAFFPVSFSKEIRALKDGGLSLRYTLRNDGREPFPCLWAAHCMLQAEDEAEVLTPYAPDAPIRLMFGPDGQSRHRLSNDPGNDAPINTIIPIRFPRDGAAAGIPAERKPFFSGTIRGRFPGWPSG